MYPYNYAYTVGTSALDTSNTNSNTQSLTQTEYIYNNVIFQIKSDCIIIHTPYKVSEELVNAVDCVEGVEAVLYFKRYSIHIETAKAIPNSTIIANLTEIF